VREDTQASGGHGIGPSSDAMTRCSKRISRPTSRQNRTPSSSRHPSSGTPSGKLRIGFGDAERGVTVGFWHPTNSRSTTHTSHPESSIRFRSTGTAHRGARPTPATRSRRSARREGSASHSASAVDLGCERATTLPGHTPVRLGTHVASSSRCSSQKGRRVLNAHARRPCCR
jgi:hypothetical protein